MDGEAKDGLNDGYKDGWNDGYKGWVEWVSASPCICVQGDEKHRDGVMGRGRNMGIWEY